MTTPGAVHAARLHLAVRAQVAACERVRIERAPGRAGPDVVSEPAHAAAHALAGQHRPGVAAGIWAPDREARPDRAVDVERLEAVDPPVDASVQVQVPEVEADLAAELEQAGRRVSEERLRDVEPVHDLHATVHLDHERV